MKLKPFELKPVFMSRNVCYSNLLLNLEIFVQKWQIHWSGLCFELFCAYTERHQTLLLLCWRTQPHVRCHIITTFEGQQDLSLFLILNFISTWWCSLTKGFLEWFYKLSSNKEIRLYNRLKRLLLIISGWNIVLAGDETQKSLQCFRGLGTGLTSARWSHLQHGGKGWVTAEVMYRGHSEMTF